MSKSYIVLYDDGDAITVPYGADPDCDGALALFSDAHPPLLFEDRSAAQHAIRISKAFARLCAAQGKPVNTDFTEGIRNVRIVPVVMAEGGER